MRWLLLRQECYISESIRKDIGTTGITVIHVNEIVNAAKTLSGRYLKECYPKGKYEDSNNNIIYFDKTISDNIKIQFLGRNNLLKISNNVSVNNLQIAFGNNGSCDIGKNTEIIGANFFITEAGIVIEKDCLFSTEIIIRNHDAHHIFDAATHKRINYPKDIIIEDNVWIGHRVTLLGGAHIGCGSVVGRGAITSSCFGDHCIIAGSPAKVIRKNICWSRENTDYFNRDSLEECVSQEALKYL